MIVVQLEVLRSSKGFLYNDHQRIGQTSFAAFDNRDGNADFSQGSLILRRGHELDKINGFRWGILADRKAIAAAYSIRNGASASLNRWEGEEA